MAKKHIVNQRFGDTKHIAHMGVQVIIFFLMTCKLKEYHKKHYYL